MEFDYFMLFFTFSCILRFLNFFSLFVYFSHSLSISQASSQQGGVTPHKHSPIRRKIIATLLRKITIGNPLRVKTPLPIPKIWRSRSAASYIPCPYGRGIGLGYRVRTLPQGRDRWGIKFSLAKDERYGSPPPQTVRKP